MKIRNCWAIFAFWLNAHFYSIFIQIVLALIYFLDEKETIHFCVWSISITERYLMKACKVIRSSDPIFCMVRDHEHGCIGAFLFMSARRADDALDLVFDTRRANQHLITEMESTRLKSHIKTAENAKLRQLLTDKLMHIKEHGLSIKLTFGILS